jgi:HSP20 family protein
MTMLTEPSAPWLRDLNRLFTTEGAVATFIPPADLLVTDEGVTVYMDVPGMDAGTLEIELENDTVSVRGERPYPYKDIAASVRRIERRFGAFERSLRVPQGLDPDTVDATLDRGVLTLRIPKPESMKPRKVQIKAADRAAQQVSGSSPEAIEGSASDGSAQQEESRSPETIEGSTS